VVWLRRRAQRRRLAGRASASFPAAGLATAHEALDEVTDALTNRPGLRAALLLAFGEVRLTTLVLATSAELNLRLSPVTLPLDSPSPDPVVGPTGCSQLPTEGLRLGPPFVSSSLHSAGPSGVRIFAHTRRRRDDATVAIQMLAFLMVLLF
jgi:hypothetical protein